MPAIVEDDEDSHQKSSGQDYQRHRQPIGYAQTTVHQVPEGQIRHDRIQDLPGAPAKSWLLVSGDDFSPSRCIRPAFRRGGDRVVLHKPWLFPVSDPPTRISITSSSNSARLKHRNFSHS